MNPRFSNLFFPSLLYLCLSNQTDYETSVLEIFRPFVPNFRAVVNVLTVQPDGDVLGEHLEARLLSLFGPNTEPASMTLPGFRALVESADSPSMLWDNARTFLQDTPYVGSMIGLLAVVKFGADTAVAWNRLKAPEALETFVSNRPISFAIRVDKERELSQAESVTRESYLAERRAKIGQRYR